MRAHLFAFALLVGTPLIAADQSVDSEVNEVEPTVAEKWECREFLRNNGRVLITLWHSAGTKPGETGYGRLQYAGASFPAAFSRDGLSLRWDWDLNEDGNWEHSFSIKPGGTGANYDFSGAGTGEKVSPSGTYTCKAAGEEEVPMDEFSEWAAWYLPLLFGDDFGEIMEKVIEENGTE